MLKLIHVNQEHLRLGFGRTYIINTILHFVFDDEGKRITELFNVLVQKNHQLGGSPHTFLYQGKIWGFTSRRRERKHVPIHFSLAHEADEVIALKNKFDNDKTRISNVLSVLLARCQTLQDVRDALPNSFVDALSHETEVYSFDSITKLPRTREPGFVYKINNKAPDQKQLKMFVEAVETAYQYIVNKLVF